MSDQTESLTFYTRLETLKKKHRRLDTQIDQELKSPAATDFYIAQLKRQKLLVKDQMAHVMSKLHRESANTA